MNDERLLVLKMLEKGKITAEEAAALLDALAERPPSAGPGVSGEEEAKAAPGQPEEPSGRADAEEDAAEAERPPHDADGASAERPEDPPLSAKAQEALDKARERVEEALKRVRESVRKTNAPEIDHIVRTVRRGVSQVLEEIPDVMNRLLRLEFRPGPGRVYEERFSGTLAPGAPVTVKVRNIDGPISVTAAEGTEYEVRVVNRVRTDDEAEAKSLSRLATVWEASESGLVLTAGNHPRVRAHVRIALPAGPVYNVELVSEDGSLTWDGVTAHEIAMRTAEGAVSVARTAARALRIHTEDGSVSVSGVTAGQITAQTGDGSVVLRRFRAGEVNVSSGDGAVAFAGAAQRLRCKTASGSVHAALLAEVTNVPDAPAGVPEAAAGAAGDVHWHIDTGDGSVHVTVPADAAYGYDVSLVTGDGRVRVDLPDVEAADGGDGRFTGRTRGFEGKPVRVRIDVRTGDGSIGVAAAPKEAET